MMKYEKYFIRRLMFLWILSAAHAAPSPLLAGDLAFAKKILTESDQFRGRREGMLLQLLLTDFEKSRKKTSSLQVKTKGSSSRVTYLSPANSRGDIVLMSGRRIWLFKKGVKRPLPLTPRQRLLGHALIGDILGTRYSDDYEPKAIENAVYDGQKVFILELRPKETGQTYDRIRYFIDAKSNFGVHAEFFALSGKLIKTADFRYHVVDPGTGPRPLLGETVIKDPVIKDDRTIVTYDSAEFIEISAAEFNKEMIGN